MNSIVATGSGTTIYAILEGGDPNETLPEDTETESQFLIKWANLSHLHNTWESLETLKENNVKGLKKLDNYCKVSHPSSFNSFLISCMDYEFE